MNEKIRRNHLQKKECNDFVLFLFQVNNEDRRLGGGGVGSPRGLSKPTIVSMSVICAISLAYAACPYEPHAKVLIYLPPIIELGK